MTAPIAVVAPPPPNIPHPLIHMLETDAALAHALCVVQKSNARIEFDGDEITIFRRDEVDDLMTGGEFGSCNGYCVGIEADELLEAYVTHDPLTGLCSFHEDGHEHTFSVYEALPILAELRSCGTI